jgi:hypothetical protein
MIDTLPVSKAIAVLALAALSAACTGFNPEFDHDGAGPDRTDDGVSTDDIVDGDDDRGTTDEPATTTGDDVGDSSDATTLADDGATESAGTTVGEGCALSEPVLFDVIARDSSDNVLPPMCGGTSTWRGAVTTGLAPNELLVAECDGACVCGVDPTTTHLRFTALEPSPADLLPEGAMDCFFVSVARSAETDGCTVEWIIVESLATSADFPSFLAASSGDPSWSVVVPGATLGQVIEPCEVHNCDPSLQPGHYELFLGADGPIAPGTTVAVDLNPYAGVETTYDITALFAQVNEACKERLGWAAILPQ